jgi:tRNA-dihydrouridine synthase
MNYNDFDRFRAQSDVDSAMVGYGALLNPSVFSPEPDSLSNMISKYLTIARQHENRLVDIQRHIAWMVKRHTPATTKAQLFDCQSIDDIVFVVISILLGIPSTDARR